MKQNARIEIIRGDRVVKRYAKHRTAISWLRSKGSRNLWRYTVGFDPLGKQRMRRNRRYTLPASAYIFSELAEEGREAQEVQT